MEVSVSNLTVSKCCWTVMVDDSKIVLHIEIVQSIDKSNHRNYYVSETSAPFYCF